MLLCHTVTCLQPLLQLRTAAQVVQVQHCCGALPELIIVGADGCELPQVQAVCQTQDAMGWGGCGCEYHQYKTPQPAVTQETVVITICKHTCAESRKDPKRSVRQ